MNETYNVVPNIISTKDLDYLSDMFEWNYGALKNTNASICQVQDQKIKEILERGCNLFQNNMNMVLNTLSEGGSNE